MERDRAGAGLGLAPPDGFDALCILWVGRIACGGGAGATPISVVFAVSSRPSVAGGAAAKSC